MNYLLSPHSPIARSRNSSLLRLPFFTVLLVLVGQLFIAGCGGSDSGGSGGTSLETPDMDTPPSIRMAEAAPLPGDPTLIFDSPADGAVILTAQDVTVKIAASDDGGIQEVRLWSKEAADAAFTPHGIGTLKNGTYQWNLGKFPLGEYTLIAKATDMDDASVIRWIAINVTAELPSDPTLTIDSPADGVEMLDSQDVMVRVSASDDSGLQEVLLWSKEAADAAFTPYGTGVLTNGTYQWNLGRLSTGSYILNAKAFANDGGEVVKSTTINIIADEGVNPPPVLTFNSPVDATDLSAAQDVMVKIAASDDSGLQEVLLWSKEAADSAFTPYGAGVLNNGIYEWNIGKLAVGVYIINAKAFANDGEEVVKSITVNVIAGVPSDPTITFNSPADGADMLDNQDVMVNITASDDSGIDKVLLWSKLTSDSTFAAQGAGTLNNGRYQWNLGQLNAGAYVLRAKAIANDGGEAAGMINLNITAGAGGGMAPTVYFVSPSNNLTRNTGYVLSIEAGASDDGEVTSVELLHNGNSIQTLTAQPYNFRSITLNVARIHTFELVATDDDGNTGTATLRVTINEPTGGGDLIVSPANGANFDAGDQIIVKTNASATFYINDFQMESNTASTRIDKELDCRFLQGGTYTVKAEAGGITDSITFTVNPEMKSGQYNFVRLNHNRPILDANTFKNAGATLTLRTNSEHEYDNLNGACVINVEGLIPPAKRVNGDGTIKYYMYFASHHGQYIRMAYSRNIEGPWKLYNVDGNDRRDRGVLTFGKVSTKVDDQVLPIGNGISLANHMASPEILVVDGEIILYFHSKWILNGVEKGPQKTFAARSENNAGLDFNGRIAPVMQLNYYAAMYEWDGDLYGSQHQARITTHPDNGKAVMNLLEPASYNGYDFTKGYWDTSGDAAMPWQDGLRNGLRHIKLDIEGDLVYAAFSCTGDSPERLYYRTLDMSKNVDLKHNDWKCEGPAIEIARAEAGWEGGQFVVEASKSSAVDGDVNQLRDPDFFIDNDGRKYIFYSGEGETAIGVGELIWKN